MNNIFIWWNLPLQIKEKLNITLLYNWFRIPTEMNLVLRQLELDKPTCYADEFEPLLLDLQKIYNIVNCTE